MLKKPGALKTGSSVSTDAPENLDKRLEKTDFCPHLQMMLSDTEYADILNN